MGNSKLIESFIALSTQGGGSKEQVELLIELIVEDFGSDEVMGAEWLVDGIAHLLDGRVMDWTKVNAEDAIFQDLQSLLIEIEMYHPASGIQVDDDGICITVRPTGSQLSLVISRTGPQYRIVRAR